MNYRGYSIEKERDGSFSVFGAGGYISGNFKTVTEAKADVDWRTEDYLTDFNYVGSKFHY